MRLQFHRADSWPRLAWLARCRRDVVHVIHGPRVEVTPEWFCEAVWDGPYDMGGFDLTDLIFGSGGRLRGEAVTFVGSGSTVDRLQVLESRDEAWVSNSLPCLLASTGARIDPTYPHYFRDFSTIRLGLSRYTPTLETSIGPIRLIYFENVVWDGLRLRAREKCASIRDFSTYARYRAFLTQALARLAENLGATARQSPFRMLGTISSGYDSPAVATLARDAGLREVISFDKSREEDGDSGREIAERLGLAVTVIARNAWRATNLPEVPFIAADAKGEDVFFKSAEDHLDGALLLTGFHGDKMWGKQTTDLGTDLARGDQSGLSLTEFRLHAGFLHCPVPFIGVRQIADVNQISRSPELAAWDIGGDYSRPICRRIVEEAGVPRTAFGMRKKAASVLLFDGTTFLTAAALAEYLPWLAAHAEAWQRTGVRPPQPLPGRQAGLLRAGVARATQLFKTPPEGAIGRAVERAARWARREPLFQWVFPWAAERARLAYGPQRDLPETLR